MTDKIHESHNVRKDDDEHDYCVRCAAYTPTELTQECLDTDTLFDMWQDDDLLDDDDDAEYDEDIEL